VAQNGKSKAVQVLLTYSRSVSLSLSVGSLDSGINWYSQQAQLWIWQWAQWQSLWYWVTLTIWAQPLVKRARAESEKLNV